MAVISGSDVRSGIVSLPAKVQVARYDSSNLTNPAIRRTGTQDYLGNFANPFDDTWTLDFTSQTLVAGTGLPSGSSYISSLVASPNTAPTLDFSGDVEVSALDSKTFYLTGSQESFRAFDDSRIHVVAGVSGSSFYATGTDETVLPGFSAPLADKIQIAIDISATTPSYAMRWNTRGLPDSDPTVLSGEFIAQERTGFMYFNFDNNTWDQITLTDPVTSAQTNQVMFHLFEGVANAPQDVTYFDRSNLKWHATGSALIGPIPPHRDYQFSMSPQIGFAAGTYQELLDMGYGTIGQPTMAGFAPNQSNLYYASPSHRIEMSDYINHPFLLEKAVIEIPVIVRRKNGNPNADAPATALVNGAIRDIDNYTFFLYRQFVPSVPEGTGSQPGLAAAVSGSQRHLIASGCASFYNSNVFNAEIQGVIDELGLPHGPAFEYDFNLDISGSANAGAESAFTGSLRIEMTPAVASGGRMGGTRFPVLSTS